jgi:hypothetical protein
MRYLMWDALKWCGEAGGEEIVSQKGAHNSYI